MGRLFQIIAWFAFVFGAAASAQDEAENVPHIYFDSSDTEVPLNITYNGQEILIYGAIDDLGDLDPDLIINVTGPPESLVVHKKGRRYGMWVNTQTMNFREVPSFLATFSDAPLDTIMLPTEKIRYDIGFDQAVPIRGIAQNIDDPNAFADEFVKLQKRDRKYILDEDGIKVSGNILFSARVPLAADIKEGDFEIEILLLQKGRVVASVVSNLTVHKSGLERWLYDLAIERGFWYGCLAIFLAIFVAFAMSRIMRLFQR